MNQTEMIDIMNFIGEHTNELDMLDQIKIFEASAELCKKVKPIYIKYKMREKDCETFVMRLGDKML